MKQLIYRSQPFGFDDAMLAGILLDARRNNLRDDITGALLCRHDMYIQLLEGPGAAIDAAYARIAVDDRHCDVRLLFTEQVDARLFAGWAMLDDQMPSLTWSPEQIAGGAIERATHAELRAIFARLAASARAADDSRLTSPGCPARP